MMNGRQYGGAPGVPDMNGGRRRYNGHHNQHNPHPQQYSPMYNNFQQPYGTHFYPQNYQPQYFTPPGPHQYNPQYNPHFAPQYHPYVQHNQQFVPPYASHVRSPPPSQHFTPQLPPQHVSYPRAQPTSAQPSPVRASPIQPFAAPPSIATSNFQEPPIVASSIQDTPIPPQTPSATADPTSIEAADPPTLSPAPSIPASVAQVVSLHVAPSIPEPSNFQPPLPWLSCSEEEWVLRRPRRRRAVVPLSDEAVELPDHQRSKKPTPIPQPAQALVRSDTPSTTHPISEVADSTQPTTPSSVLLTSELTTGDVTPTPKPAPKATIPAVPALPTPRVQEQPKDVADPAVQTVNGEETQSAEAQTTEEKSEPVPATKAPAWTTPKLWTGLFNPGTASSVASAGDRGGANGEIGAVKNSAETLAEALRTFDATSNGSKIAFLEPKGLVNTGNMCYMNSVLQVLVFCSPFYAFLDQVGKKAAHSFKSETPLLDAMILFMREYPVIDSASSVEQLRMRLKDGELEQYGESFTPDFIYNVINRLPRFSSMRRGHQQDAEEFLGFLLEGLHDECAHVVASSSESAFATPAGPSSPASEFGSVHGSASGRDNGWLEVGPKQKSAVTRSSGTVTSSPITKIFGGSLRSELRVPGLKDSVTLEPYQPLQLDIGAPGINNIIDALRGLTRSEPLHGDFKSPKGPNVTATKQVFIETLPPVLILHLKRFQYDNAGGTQKIWKKIGYPLELELPKEVFPRQKRGVFAHSGLPKYRLTAVVYHHGKNASGGHYTVDVRRQDGREWIRLDDTVIRRVRSEEVAEGGSEEDPKILAAAAEAQKHNATSVNGFAAIDEDHEDTNEEEWKEAKKASGPGKKWSNVVTNGTTTKPKVDKFSVKDNKVAYILFYQKI